MKQERITNKSWLSVVLIIGLSAFLYVSQTSQVSAAQTKIYAENFAVSPLQSWNIVQNKQWGNDQKPCMFGTTPANWTVTQGKAKIQIEGPSCVIDFAPTSLDLRGLPEYTVDFKMTFSGSVDMDRSFVFLWQDSKNWYDLKMYGNSFQVQKVVDGKAYPLPNSLAHFPVQPNREYQFNIFVVPQQRIKVTVEGIVILDIGEQAPFIQQNSPHTVALRGSVGAVPQSISVFDDVTVTADIPTDTSTLLNVPLFKQTDPLWRNDEYDHAQVWSDNPTMNRWGCAVSSMAMILKYHSITQLPNGQSLTPQTLNNWLKQEVDGYIQGNVNWLAVTRLTRIMSAQLNTPKLEFSRVDGPEEQMIELTKKEIAAQKPVILHIPGHFLVADGINTSAKTLTIKDPAYTYTLLSQHQKNNERVDSIRRFQPSHTDLSYLFVTFPEGANIQVKNSKGELIETQPTTEYLQSFDDEQKGTAKSPVLQQILIAKPESETYSFTVTQNETKKYQLGIYSYDIAGNVQLTQKTGTAGPEGQTVSLKYQKEENVQLENTVSWSSFRRELARLIKLRKVVRSFVTVYLDHIARFADRSPLSYQRRYISLCEYFLRGYRPFMKKDAYQSLSQQLESLKEQTKPKSE
jgi:hypothetical protein